MPPWLASHLICELYHDIIFLLRVKFVNNFSTFNYSFCASAIRHGHGKSGVETRSSEQTMLSDEAHVLLVTDSSLEEDSETDDQSYTPPPGACPNLAGLCCSYCVYGILHCYVICLV